MVKTAVILAAGMGSRLKERTKDMPKGFLRIGTEAIVIRSIKALIKAGIERIVIGTGYLSAMYKELAFQYPQIECVENNNYMTTGSMETLYHMKNSLNSAFLLLESDLLYEKASLSVLIDSKEDNLILSSGATNSNDEVYIEVDDEYNLVGMSKDKTKLRNIYSELVGISKISVPLFKAMCDSFEEAQDKKLDYEECIVRASKRMPVKVLKITDLAWTEIDNEYHLQRAKRIIYQRILEKEGTTESY